MNRKARTQRYQVVSILMHQSISDLQSRLGIAFRDVTLLKQAFTHSSYVNEHKIPRYRDNERLEFLGDAVLELTVSDYLYDRYPKRSEGELTKLRARSVCEPALHRLAEDLSFGSYVLLGKGEELTGGRTRPALLADVFEAFVGALYLDQGLEVVRLFLSRHMFPKIAGAEDAAVLDYKTQLQEYIQQRGMGALEYRIVEERGPAHEKFFVSEVVMDGETLGRGSGRSKKESEQQAAAQAMKRWTAPHSKSE